MKLFVYMSLSALLVLGGWWLWHSNEPPSPSAQLNFELWQDFKTKFINQGRVIDFENGQISHSEGQGYAMLMALAANDHPTFDALWQWTQSTLTRQDGLFAWQYTPCEYHDSRCVSDWNNATDGEILIAWALLKAHRQWKDEHYLSSARNLTTLILEKLIVEQNGQAFLIPGQAGFIEPGRLTLNASYWVFPALEDFDRSFPSPMWSRLIQSGMEVSQIGFGDVNLPLDWVDVLANGELTFSHKFEPIYGFNAVRILLHQAWSSEGLTSTQLNSYLDFWSKFEPPVAWINVETEETSNYAWSTGMQAIAEFAQARASGYQLTPQDIPRPKDEEGYFSWSLVLLTHIAIQETE